MPCMQAVQKLKDMVQGLSEDICGDVIVLPLYAALPPEQQVYHVNKRWAFEIILMHDMKYRCWEAQTWRWVSSLL